MPNTANAGLPYPSTGAADNVPYDLQQLAEALDTLLGASSPEAAISLSASHTTPVTAKSRKRNKNVKLTGEIQLPAAAPGSSSGTLGTLAVGHRPAGEKTFPLMANAGGAIGKITITPAGLIQWATASASTTIYIIHLYNIDFDVDF